MNCKYLKYWAFFIIHKTNNKNLRPHYRSLHQIQDSKMPIPPYFPDNKKKNTKR